MTTRRRVAGIAAVVVSALAVPLPHAAARTYYEYWSYWHKPPGTSSWQYSNVGPSGYYLKAGRQVEGWRYAVGTAGPGDPQPRPTDVSYDAYCAGKDADKTYRVLLVVDYGTASGAPAGPVYSCYGFDDAPSGFQVLTQQHTERDNSGLICAIDGYPRAGCGDTASSPASSKPSTHPTATAHGSPPSRPAARHPSGTTPVTGVVTAAGTAPRAAATNGAPTARAAGPGTTPSASPSPSPASASASPTLHAIGFEPPADRSSFPVGLVIGVAGVAALGAGAWWLRRRAG